MSFIDFAAVKARCSIEQAAKLIGLQTTEVVLAKYWLTLEDSNLHIPSAKNLCLSEIKLAHTDDEVRREMA
jgi:hypothetical protein